jgi:flagellar hook-associated protein 1 FlgK
MSSLSGSMLMAVNSLLVQQGALEATTNNIANVNTPGYSREIANMTEATPTVEGNLVYGQGVTLQSITSVRDRLLEISMDGATQQQSGAQAQLSSLQQVQNLFSSTTSGLGTDLTAFFNSLNQLSTDPTNIPDRQSVLATANNLASDFNSTSEQLTGIQNNLNLNVSQSVDQINQLTSQIATLNTQVASLQKLGIDPGSIEDERDQLETQLSQVAGASITQTADGDTITIGNGSALVVGGQSFAVQSSTDANGNQQVFASGQDITADIQGGQLGGVLQVRDQFLPTVTSELDSLASGLATNFNAAHEQGFDLSGNAGQQFFNDTTGAGAAAKFSVAITDPSLIAASSDGSAGSNGNLAALQAVQTQALPSGQTPTDTYSNLTYNVGNATAQAQAAQSAAQLSLNQITDQRQAVSGVSIDEETTNLIRYQNAYSAAARVITTIDELTQTLLNMATAIVG